MANERITQVRANVATSAAELRTFVASLKGRSPAEAMGVVGRSHLVRATAISLVLQVAIVLLLTVVPHALAEPEEKKTPAAPAPVKVSSPAEVKGSDEGEAPKAAPSETGKAAPTAPAATQKPAVKEPEAAPAPKLPDVDDLLKNAR